MSEPLEFWLRVKYSVFSTLIFLLVTNPMVVKLFGTEIKGYFFQVVLFFFATLGLMMFPKDR